MAPRRFSALLESARGGDEQAWAELYGRLAPPMLGYLRANRAPDPEDVCSEAMLQVARDLHGFEGDEQGLRAWALTITHHRLLDSRRHLGRRPVEPMAEPPEPDADPADDVATKVLGRISGERVASILATLSPDQSAVLTLRIIGELTVAEVAKLLGKREGAVKQLQRRGLAAVERELERGGVTL